MKVLLTILLCIISGIISGYLANPENGSYTCFVEAGFAFSISIALLNFQNFKQKILFIAILSTLWPPFVIVFFFAILWVSLAFDLLTFSLSINEEILALFAVILFSFLSSLLALSIYELIRKTGSVFSFLGSPPALSIFELITKTSLILIKILIVPLVIGITNGIIYFKFPPAYNSILWRFIVGEVLLGGYIAFINGLKQNES